MSAGKVQGLGIYRKISTLSWEYGAYRVSRFKCDNCNSYFNLYEAEGRKSCTIPRSEAK